MDNDISQSIDKVTYSPEIEQAFTRCKKKDPYLFKRVQNQILKILRDPSIGKPLRYTLKNRRRVHINPFVLVYEFHNGELRFIDFDHHDKIYR